MIHQIKYRVLDKTGPLVILEADFGNGPQLVYKTHKEFAVHEHEQKLLSLGVPYELLNEYRDLLREMFLNDD